MSGLALRAAKLACGIGPLAAATGIIVGSVLAASSTDAMSAVRSAMHVGELVVLTSAAGLAAGLVAIAAERSGRHRGSMFGTGLLPAAIAANGAILWLFAPPLLGLLF